ncbi:aspartyl-tRNA(Asn)/glutamyl-tRNA(Gln) amidotransferase subunit A [Loktanella atrilutea]|uniref:Aspartyl-tRNA(Asn)/glutamyl-tRNA(Gln) amidotransferase subunit A n=2 Tax=Loktanella atrilutea TaxID=366533 RepID=A0A1M5DAU3_LOKAT|nr:aspartyl-tRNA(Asn)/glutamyl-tRNA(Gln) amidotransferase subunit A [Loktanella atrilutea]
MQENDVTTSDAALPELSVAEAAAALRDGTLTSARLTRAHLDLIARRDPQVRAFVHLTADRATAAAAQADADFARGIDRGPLQGIPFAIKDLIDVAGATVTFGALRHADRTATTTATAVQRLLDAGAVPLGMVATYDLALVGPSQDGPYPPARNPWHTDHITGGSSSGSAAAVAAGLVRVALGTDTGGSIRSPAAYCGVVGLKPTFGAVPIDGVQPLAPGLDHLGPIARTVADAAFVFAALTGTAPPDLSGNLQGLRVGYARHWAEGSETTPALLDRLDDAVATLSQIGAQFALVTLPDIALMEAAGAVIIHAEALDTHAADVTGTGGPTGRMAYQSLIAGAALTSEDVARARAAAVRLRAGIDTVLDTCDVIITATTLTPAPSFSAFAGGRAVWTPMRTLPFNATGHPALSVPMEFVDGLPVGLQIIGRHGEEARLLQVGAAFEAATDHAVQRPPYLA